VAGQLRSVRFGADVTEVTYDDGVYTLSVDGPAGPEVLRARRLVLGTGTSPYIPASCRQILGAGGPVLHNADYLARKTELQQRRSITIVGSGQSAAEIYYELLQDIDVHGYQLNWVTRSGRFFPLEYTKLTLEMTSPEYVDYFHGLPQGRRDSLVRSQQNLYKGINSELIDAIYDLLYTKSLSGMVDTRLLTHSAVTGAGWNASAGSHTLELSHGEQGTDYSLETEAVVLATGTRTVSRRSCTACRSALPGTAPEGSPSSATTAPASNPARSSCRTPNSTPTASSRRTSAWPLTGTRASSGTSWDARSIRWSAASLSRSSACPRRQTSRRPPE
jgi:lysine/ornithine N-monooxygenase